MVYQYLCPKDGVFDKAIALSRRRVNLWAQRCPQCGRRCGRELRSLARVQGEIKPRYSWSLGKSRNQAGIPGEVYDDKGRMLIRNRQHERAVTKRVREMLDRNYPPES